jgi:predicted nucleotidyltransferase
LHNLVSSHRTELVHLCKLYGVKHLELFGSATSNDPESDIGDLDFLVEFLELDQSAYADAYFGLLESLQDLFKKPVDLVMPSAIKNPYFLRGIEKDRTLLYAA